MTATTIDRLMSIRFLRFAIVGGFSGAVYAAVSIALVELEIANRVLASTIGYLAAIPTNFIGQKRFAFRSKDKASCEFIRFLLVQGTNIMLSAAVMYLVAEVLGFSYLLGVILVIATIPFSTYLLLKVFVFVGS